MLNSNFHVRNCSKLMSPKARTPKPETTLTTKLYEFNSVKLIGISTSGLTARYP